MKYLACALSGLDALLTLYVIKHLGASEANPVMKALLALGPVPFVAVKVVWVFAVLELAKLYCKKYRESAEVLACVLYGGVCVYTSAHILLA